MSFYDTYNNILSAINGVIWANWVLYTVLGVGLLFTIWTGFCQYRALVHGTAVVRGKYDDKDAPGAINHFQALSAALSATVGLGNIAGVAVAIALGGPGAIFWMWMVGLAGMALKTTEVTLSMLYRNTDDPDNPHGGPMWVASKGFAQWGWGGFGKLFGGLFCITLLISTTTGGNMFQAWNVGQATKEASNGSIPPIAAGIILAVLAGAVILGGIKRIGAVAGRLVPFMVAIYLIAAFVVLFMNFADIPAMLKLIVVSALPDWLGGEAANPERAFVGGTFAYALFWGMKRALFSSEAGQGSSPIAHSAAKTDEPVREGIVAGLEPFIDTIVVCTLTSLVILSTGAWNRGHETLLTRAVTLQEVEPAPDAEPSAMREWTLRKVQVDPKNKKARDVGGDWNAGDNVFMIMQVAETNKNTGFNLERMEGVIVESEDENDEALYIEWKSIESAAPPQFPTGENEGALYKDYPGAALTQYAFNLAIPGLGTWLILLASWLFALSTIISWNYYGEQGVVYLFGEKLIIPYRLIYCALIVVATGPFIQTDADLDNLTALGTGVMLWANIPIMLIFGGVAMGAYHKYGKKLKAGEFHPHAAPKVTDVVEGRDVE